MRRNLSGIYIFDTLPQDDGRRKPTCIEDCTAGTRLSWLEGLAPEALKNTAEHMNEVLEKLWDMLTPEERSLFGDKLSVCVCKDSPADIDRSCRLVRFLADAAGIYAPGSEADPNEKDI